MRLWRYVVEGYIPKGTRYYFNPRDKEVVAEKMVMRTVRLTKKQSANLRQRAKR
jgi:hypothetical protein